MTVDGGLERLVHLLLDFTLSPPPPTNPSLIYGLSLATATTPPRQPVLNPSSYDKHAAYRFSLAFQCVVNIGVRGSEPIRQRVVQAGTLDVVGRILEAWLASKGFAVGPGIVGNGRETRNQRQARRQQQLEQRQREQAVALARALQREVALTYERISMQGGVAAPVESETIIISPRVEEPLSSASSGTTSGVTSDAETPNGSSTPTGSVEVFTRDRSGTILARPVWDQPPNNAVTRNMPPMQAVARATSRANTIRASASNTRRALPHRMRDSSGGPSAGSRPDPDVEEDGDVEMSDQSRVVSDSEVDPETSRDPSPNPEAGPDRTRVPISPQHVRRAVGIVNDTAASELEMNLDPDAHIIITAGEGGVGVGVEEGIVSLEQNDDFALGAPPGAPGAIEMGTQTTRTQTPEVMSEPEVEVATTPADGGDGRRMATDATPRAVPIALPGSVPPLPATAGEANTSLSTPSRMHTVHLSDAGTTTTNATIDATPTSTTTTVNRSPVLNNAAAANMTTGPGTGTNTTATATPHNHPHHHHHRESDGPYRDEDVLLSLQLLAYLSKYPHVRQAFYKPRVAFHPATAGQVNPPESAAQPSKAAVFTGKDGQTTTQGSGFFKAFRSETKNKGKAAATAASAAANPASGGAVSSQAQASSSAPPRMTNVFALVERFTFRPSSIETESPNPPPMLPAEIQYWAGVIMRNACRKDESRGGIRQCANMLCGRWESYPREFAKCRRCRKAKYCGKECQSTAWSEGHRFWCSAKDGDEDPHHNGNTEPGEDGRDGARRGRGHEGESTRSVRSDVTVTTGARSREVTATNAGTQTTTAGTARDTRRQAAQPPLLPGQTPAAIAAAFRTMGNPNVMLGDWPRRGMTPEDALRRAMMQLAPRRGDLDGAPTQDNTTPAIRQEVAMQIETTRTITGTPEMDQDGDDGVTFRAANMVVEEDSVAAAFSPSDDAMMLD